MRSILTGLSAETRSPTSKSPYRGSQRPHRAPHGVLWVDCRQAQTTHTQPQQTMNKTTRVTYDGRGSSVEFSTYGDNISVRSNDTVIAFSDVPTERMRESFASYVRSYRWNCIDDSNADRWLQGLIETINQTIEERAKRSEKAES